MTAHRSRNKLERKAHMNIHDTVEVRDEIDPAKACHTRDRFGKRHGIAPCGRRVAKTTAVIGVWCAMFFPSVCSADAETARGTDIRVDSVDFGVFSLNEKTRSKNEPSGPKQDMGLELTDDGPNLNLRF